MNDRQVLSDEDLEISEYLEASKELEAAGVLEAAEFIDDRDDEEGEPEEAASGETQDAPVHLMDDETARQCLCGSPRLGIA